MNNAWTRRGLVVVAMLVVVGVSGLLSERWFGQTLAAPEAEPPKSQDSSIALLDVAYIFKNHKSFNDKMKVLEDKAINSQLSMQATQAQLELLKSRMEQTEDKVEKDKLEVKLAKQGAEHQLLVRNTQEEIAKLEAKIYYDVYTLLQEETKKYCRARGIHVVLKFSRDPIKADDRNSVMQGLARPIIFSDAPDISVEILKAIDSAAETKAANAKVEDTKSR